MTHLLAHHCDLKPKEFIHHIGNAHIYDDHFEPLAEQIKREPLPFPTITIKSKHENIEDYNNDELSLNGIMFVDVGWEEEYEGAYQERLQEHYFVRNWLESKGYDALTYENEFEKGGESIMVLRSEQVKIIEKIYLNQENKIENKNKKKIKP